MKAVLYFVLIGTAATAAVACDLCAVYTATEAQGAGRGLYGGLAEQFTHYGTLSEDGDDVPDPADQSMDSSILQVLAGYNVNDRFGLQINVPLIHREFRRLVEHDIDEGTVAGIGDAILTANYLAYERLEEDGTVRWSVLGGVKLPTGDSDRLGESASHGDEEEGHAAEEDPADHAEADEEDVDAHAHASVLGGHDLALGSGSYDGILGTGVSARWKRWFASGNLQYAIRTEGDFDYEYGDDLTWSAGPGAYLALTHDHTFTLQALTSGETKEKDTVDGVEDDHTETTLVYLGPQLGYTRSSALSAELGADFPVHTDNSDLGLVPDYRLRAAVLWRF